jgi:hypothetical protein
MNDHVGPIAADGLRRRFGLVEIEVIPPPGERGPTKSLDGGGDG